ncbi:MAG: translation initiation factor IF-2 N-terminal domain-containing protein [Anaerococcus hydrogenalis]|nr:translation initiation factor IF-2 N-terminal domain-containing protein [Anaerococcus hydrogenalis]
MANKLRIYELAKKHNKTTKDMLSLLKEEFGLKIKSHMSVLSGDELDIVEEYFSEDAKKSESQAKDNLKEDKKEEKKPKNIEKKSNKKEENISEKKPSNKKNKKSSNKKEKKKNKKQNKRSKKSIKREAKTENNDDGNIYIPESISVKSFAEKLDENANQVIMKLMGLGVMAGLNDQIEFDQAELVALEFNKEISKEVKLDEIEIQEKDLDFEDDKEDLQSRPPVVSVMGHVDHGKTSILDAIRNTQFASGEAGGITQHIGASTVDINDKEIVFLDTPGHEAFTQMRMRGAQSTDIAILVVAGDDGVMPQTIEAINHAKAAEIPIIVAINKMDKEESDPNRVKQELTEYGLVSEDWGGDTIMVEVSARTGGLIIEAQLDKSRGAVATVLVQKGTLHDKDYVVTGSSSGRIRAMFNSKGQSISKAGPSTPVQILGLSDVAEAGDKIFAVEDEKTARAYADRAKEQKREERLIQKSNTNLEDMYEGIEEGELKELNIIVKTDVKGTVDAVSSSFSKLSNEEVFVNVIAGAVGGISESDVLLAQASNAIIIGFNVRPTQGALQMAEENNIEIRTYSIIYEAIEDVEKALKGMLDPEFEEKILGRAKVQETFKIPSAGTIAGVLVTNGSIPRSSKIRLLRDNVVIFDGEIESMKRFKDDAKVLNNGYEGGIGLEKFNDIKEGDELEAYQMVEKERV